MQGDHEIHVPKTLAGADGRLHPLPGTLSFHISKVDPGTHYVLIGLRGRAETLLQPIYGPTGAVQNKLKDTGIYNYTYDAGQFDSVVLRHVTGSQMATGLAPTPVQTQARNKLLCWDCHVKYRGGWQGHNSFNWVDGEGAWLPCEECGLHFFLEGGRRCHETYGSHRTSEDACPTCLDAVEERAAILGKLSS